MERELKSFNYGGIAGFYDSIEVDSTLNETLVENIDNILSEASAKCIWDAACGTGIQAIALAKLGYRVIASDLSPEMLEVARAKKTPENIEFHHGDIKSFECNTVDAVISMTNVLGHFDKAGFQQILRNVGRSLKNGDLYIADFENRTFLEHPGRIPANFFLSGEGCVDDEKVERFTRAVPLGLGMYSMKDVWRSNEKVVHDAEWDLKAWYLEEVETLLEEGGFSIKYWTDRKFSQIDRNHLSELDSLLFVAEKRGKF